MAQSDAAGNSGSEFQRSASAPLEGKADALTHIEGPLAEGQRQPWWPEGVNSELEMQNWKPSASDVGKSPEELEAEATAAHALEGDDAAKAKEDATKKVTTEAALTDDQIKENLTKAGGVYADPKYLPFAIEVERTGKLSPESVTKAATDFGVDPAYIETFVKGQLDSRELAKLQAGNTQNAALQKIAVAVNGVFTGDTGPADYEAFIKWGAEGTNLTDSQRKAYDSAMDRGDTDTVSTLLGAFRERWLMDGNGTRRDITRASTATSQPSNQALKPFGSLAEGRAQMNTRRYAQDAAFRTEVDSRYAITE